MKLTENTQDAIGAILFTLAVLGSLYFLHVVNQGIR